MRSNGYYRLPPSLSRIFQGVSRRLMTLQKQKMNCSKGVPKFKLSLVLVLSLLLIGCAGTSSAPPFPKPHPAVADEIAPCVKEGSHLHDWLDRLKKLEEQIDA